MTKRTTIGYVCTACDKTFFAPEGFPDELPDECPDCNTVLPWEMP